MCYNLILKSGFIFFIVIQSCSNSNMHVVYKSDKSEPVSAKVELTELIKKPENYRNQIIEVIGVYKSAMEESALYSNSFSHDTKQAIWISFNKNYPLIKDKTEINLLDSYQEFEKINAKKIKLKGRFNPDLKGHLSGFGGTIENVFYLEVYN